MYAIEFRTKMIDGIIKVPKKYRPRIKRNVKVILLTEDVVDTSFNMIGELLKHPLRIPDFRPLRRETIYDRI